MRITQKSLAIPLLALSVHSYADVNLVAGEGVSLLAINGLETQSGLIAGEKSLNLANGLHQVIAQYTAEVKKDSDTELEKT